MGKLVTPSCIGCKDFLWYLDRKTIYDHGVRINCGDRLCLCGKYTKRARKFKGNDPKTKVPSWCPKRKEPHELRIYEFKDANTWYLNEMLTRELGKPPTPSGYAYCVAYEGTTTMSAKDFWNCPGNAEDQLELLIECCIHVQDIVEIDDGLESAFFLKTTKGYELLTLFNADAARKNQRRKRTKTTDSDEEEYIVEGD